MQLVPPHRQLLRPAAGLTAALDGQPVLILDVTRNGKAAVDRAHGAQDLDAQDRAEGYSCPQSTHSAAVFRSVAAAGGCEFSARWQGRRQPISGTGGWRPFVR